MRNPMGRWDTSELWALARAEQIVLLIQDYAVPAISALQCRIWCLGKYQCRMRWPEQNTELNVILHCFMRVAFHCVPSGTASYHGGGWTNLMYRCTVFFQYHKTLAAVKHTLEVYLSPLSAFLFETSVPLHSSANLICTPALFNGCYLVGLGFCFGSAFFL